MKKAIWISYDLGIEGDYQGFYKWLDTNKAIECGDSFAFFFKQISAKDDIPTLVKKEIKQFVSLKKSDRVYLIYRSHTEKKVKGEFIFGARKRAPWEGFANQSEGIDSIDTLEDE